jgi:hypothetical protein
VYWIIAKEEAMSIRRVLVLGLVFLLSMVAGAGAQLTITATGPVQRFALATSNFATCTNPPGPCGVLVSLPINLRANSHLTITFSARGVVSQASTQIVGTAIGCNVDGKPCEPDSNGVDFQYPAGCCDSRSFTWITSAARGTHTVNITWTTNNSGSTFLQNRTLNVDAIAGKEGAPLSVFKPPKADMLATGDGEKCGPQRPGDAKPEFDFSSI